MKTVNMTIYARNDTIYVSKLILSTVYTVYLWKSNVGDKISK